VFALMATSLLTVLGAAIVMGTVTETAIAARHRDGIYAFYAADSALAHTLVTLDGEADWSVVVPGAAWRRVVEAPLSGLIGAGDDEFRAVVTVWARDAGGGVVELRVRAVHGDRARVVEATAARRDGSTRLLSWQEGR
jgi:hypothetical protein